ncbi:MAG: hypothetical protein LC798_15590 [Chloroflexi bacterium]|nr:hypothetical protein [Chloroflexota bacterium]
MTQHIFYGPHAEVADDGAPVIPGQRITLDPDSAREQDWLDQGWLVPDEMAAGLPIEMSDSDLAAWVPDATVTDVLARVGADVDLARRVLMIEQARGDDARKGITEPLAKITDREDGS